MKCSTSAMFRAIIQFTDLFTFIDTKYCYFLCAAMTSTKSLRGKGYSQNSWVGLCGLFLKTLTRLMTKSVIFSTLIYDLKFNILFMTIAANSCPKYSLRAFVGGLINNEEVPSSNKHIQFTNRVQKPYTIDDQNGWKTIPLGSLYEFNPCEEVTPSLLRIYHLPNTVVLI